MKDNPYWQRLLVIQQQAESALEASFTTQVSEHRHREFGTRDRSALNQIAMPMFAETMRRIIALSLPCLILLVANIFSGNRYLIVILGLLAFCATFASAIRFRRFALKEALVGTWKRPIPKDRHSGQRPSRLGLQFYPATAHPT